MQRGGTQWQSLLLGRAELQTLVSRAHTCLMSCNRFSTRPSTALRSPVTPVRLT